MKRQLKWPINVYFTSPDSEMIREIVINLIKTAKLIWVYGCRRAEFNRLKKIVPTYGGTALY